MGGLGGGAGGSLSLRRLRFCIARSEHLSHRLHVLLAPNEMGVGVSQVQKRVAQSSVSALLSPPPLTDCQEQDCKYTHLEQGDNFRIEIAIYECKGCA